MRNQISKTNFFNGFLFVLASMALTSFTACGGSAGGFVDDIPDAAVSASLVGSWDLTLTITDTDCAAMSEGDSENSSSMTVNVTEEGCQQSLEETYNPDYGFVVTCKAGADQLAWDATYEETNDNGCKFSGSESVKAILNPDTNELEGDYVASRSFSGDCSEFDAESTKDCTITGTISGSTSPASMEAPSIDSDPNDTPTAGGDTPTAGDDTPTAGDDTPTAGDDTPTADDDTLTGSLSVSIASVSSQSISKGESLTLTANITNSSNQTDFEIIAVLRRDPRVINSFINYTGNRVLICNKEQENSIMNSCQDSGTEMIAIDPLSTEDVTLIIDTDDSTFRGRYSLQVKIKYTNDSGNTSLVAYSDIETITVTEIAVSK